MLQPQYMPFLHSDGDDAPEVPLFYPSAKLPPTNTSMDDNPNGTLKLPPLQTSDAVLNGSAIAPSPAPISASQEPVNVAPPGRASTDPPRTSHSSASTSGLRVPIQQQRRSSPAAYSQPPHPAPRTSFDAVATTSPLQHRHTLEVPRSSTSRISQEHQTPTSVQTEPALLQNGKLSPTTPPARDRRKTSITLSRRFTKSLHSDQHLEDVPQDEDASRWAEQIRQKRASRRRRKEEEDDEKVVVGTKVDQHHVNYVTAYNMLTGIRFTVSRTNAKIRRGDLTEAHFTAAHKFSFDV